MTSPNGIDWTSQTSPNNNQLISIIWASGLSIFCIIARQVGDVNNPNNIIISSDGINWRAIPADATIARDWIGITWSPELGVFSAIQNSGDIIITSNRLINMYDYVFTGVILDNKKTPFQGNELRSIGSYSSPETLAEYNTGTTVIPYLTEKETTVGTYSDNTYTSTKRSIGEYTQSTTVDVSMISFLKIGSTNSDEYYIASSSIKKTFSNLLFDPSINITTIHNNPLTKKINFTYKVATYVDEISFTLLEGINTIDSKHITPNNEIINLYNGDNTNYTVELDYSSTELEGKDLQLHYEITNTVGTQSKQVTGDIDVGDELDAYPVLTSAEFRNISSVRYVFDISKDFVDDVINSNIHDGSFSFEPFGVVLGFADVSKVDHSTKYTVTVDIPNQDVVYDTTYTFRVDTLLHNTKYPSDTISEKFELMIPIQLKPITFTNPNEVEYEFDISKSIFDDILKNEKNDSFTFSPIGTEVSVSAIQKNVNGNNYTITQKIDYSNHFTNDTTFTFSVTLNLQQVSGIVYSSNSISKHYILPTPTFELEFLPDHGINNKILVKNLGFSNSIFSNVSREDITFMIQTNVPGYTGTQITPYTVEGTDTDVSFMYYFSKDVEVVVELEYSGVSGSTSHSDTTETKLIPFDITRIDITNIDESTRTVAVEVVAYTPLEFYKVELKSLSDGNVIDIDDTTLTYSNYNDPDDYIISLANISDICGTMTQIQRTGTLTYQSDNVLDDLRIYAYTMYDGVKGNTDIVPVNLTFTEITSMTAFLTTPAFIDLSFDVGTLNADWRVSSNKGFIDIYEYRSSTPFNISTIPSSSFTQIKTCRLNDTDPKTKIQKITGKDNEYLVNTYLENRPIINGWYYGYYMDIGLFNEANHQLVRRDDTVRAYIHFDVIGSNTYSLTFTTGIGNGLIGTGEHTIPILAYPFIDNPVSSPFYDYELSKFVYSTVYTHVGTSNTRSVVYTVDTNPSTSLGEFPVNINALEYVDDTSLVQVEIALNYRVDAQDDISNVPTEVVNVSTFIQPLQPTNLTVQKTLTNNVEGIHLQWSHTGIVEDFLITVVNITTDTEDASYEVAGKYVIGTDTSNTEYAYSIDISYESDFVDSDISFSVIPRFYGVNGESISDNIVFVFEAVDISFAFNYPYLITFDYSINGVQQEEATQDIAVLIGVSDNDITNPLRVDENDVFAIFRNPEDTQEPKRLQQKFYNYPQPDASNLLFSSELLDLSYGFEVDLVVGKYYYFTVCPVVNVPDRGVIISPPSDVTKIQLKDISGIDISLVFHQDYTQSWLGFDASNELARFGIEDTRNILEIKYTVWNGWANNVVFNVVNNDSLDFSVVDSSYTIPTNRVYSGISFEGFADAPRYQAFTIQEIYNSAQLIQQGDYLANSLFFTGDPSGNAILTDISNINTDLSNTYYTLSDHYLIQFTSTPNVSVQALQQLSAFETDTSAVSTISTPVRPSDVSLGQFYAYNLWTVNETRAIHIYLQNYDFADLDVSALQFRITAYDVSLDDYLTWTEDESVELNDYVIGLNTQISFDEEGFDSDKPVFGFDVSYLREEETTEVDISIVAVYYGVESDTVVRALNLITTKPVVDASSIPNPTTNPDQDPKEIQIDLSFVATDIVRSVNMRVFVSDVSISNYSDSGVLPDASFSNWYTVSGERLERIDTHTVEFTTYKPNEGLREFTWYYFQFQGVYGNTMTNWSDTYEFRVDELIERAEIDMSFVGYNLPYFAIDLPNVIGQAENIEDIYPYNRLIVSVEDVSYVQSYTLNFHYTENIVDISVGDLPYVNFYLSDYVSEIDVTPRYDNIVLGESATQTVSLETLIVPIIDLGSVDLGTSNFGNILINWNSLPFASGYRIYRSVYENLVMEPEDVSLQLIATTLNPSIDKYYDTRIRTNSGGFLRQNPFVYYGIQAIYDISGETVYSDISPLVYFSYDIGCVCPLPQQILKFNSSGVIRQISNRRRIAQLLGTGRKYF